MATDVVCAPPNNVTATDNITVAERAKIISRQLFEKIGTQGKENPRYPERVEELIDNIALELKFKRGHKHASYLAQLLDIPGKFSSPRRNEPYDRNVIRNNGVHVIIAVQCVANAMNITADVEKAMAERASASHGR